MEPEFEVHMLNDAGKIAAKALADKFSDTLEYCRALSGPSKYVHLAAHELEKACFYAKKAMAQNPTYQESK